MALILFRLFFFPYRKEEGSSVPLLSLFSFSQTSLDVNFTRIAGAILTALRQNLSVSEIEIDSALNQSLTSSWCNSRPVLMLLGVEGVNSISGPVV